MEDKTFELLEKMYIEMRQGFKETDEGFKEINERFKETNERLAKIEGRVTIIEQDHGKKLDLLFDGYKQNSDKLDRIEKEVSKHEEVILRRIK